MSEGRKPTTAGIVCLLLAFGTGILGAQNAPASPGPGQAAAAQPPMAADFSLVDQNNEAYRFSTTRGKIVVLGFIYTHCADICPFVTMKIKIAHELLGTDADKVAFLAITTDPERDTPTVIANYSKAAGMENIWHFLTGTPDEVKKVWSEYGVRVQEEQGVEDSEGQASSDQMRLDLAKGLGDAELALARSLIGQFAGGYALSHSGPIWIIDAQRRIRAILDAETQPSDIVRAIRAAM